MRYKALWIAAVALSFSLVALADQTPFNLAAALKFSFEDVASLASRLPLYNEHDDAARATYTCCKPDQEKEILRALAANAAFLHKYPHSIYSDDALMHNVRLAQVRHHFRLALENLLKLVNEFPDSDLADDAAWHLAQYYRRDKDHVSAVRVLTDLVRRWPTSTYADDALFALALEFKELDDPDSAFAALEELAQRYPASDFGPMALCRMAQRFMEVQNYEAAIAVSEELMRRYPMSDCVDNCQMRIAEALRHMGDLRGALEAYVWLIENLPGSQLCNRAMREANTLIRQLRQRRQPCPFEPYDPNVFDPGKEAKELWEYANHLENYHRFAEAIAAYQEFLARFPGSDWYDDAMYHIGLCYQKMDIFFQELNRAKGPEDLLRLQAQWEDATGAYGTRPTPGQFRAVNDAVSAFALLANNFIGSPLRDDAVYQISRTFVEYGKRREEVPPDEAYALQQLILNFPGSEYEFEALVRLVRFYSRASNWEDARQLYPELAAALPGIFPPGLENNKDAFYEFFKLIARRTEFAWFESHEHHIPYAFTVHDLAPFSAYVQAAMAMEDGLYPTAIRLLTPLAQMPTHDLHGPALWLLGNCYARVGQPEQARSAFAALIQMHENSGLADDARWMLEHLTSLPKAPGGLAGNLPIPPERMDIQPGRRTIVLCPWTVSAALRAYNLPQVWDAAQAILEDWTGERAEAKPVIYVAPAGGSRVGRPIMVCACKIKDPPDWAAGFAEIAELHLRDVCGQALAKAKPIIGGLTMFAALSVQYDLVRETRDAIGSASAVALPQEAVVKGREKAVEAFDDFVREGPSLDRLTPEVVCGMLFKLLDVQGLSKDRLIDREPYRQVFAELRQIHADSPVLAFIQAVDRAMGGQARQYFRNWHIPVEGMMTRAM